MLSKGPKTVAALLSTVMYLCHHFLKMNRTFVLVDYIWKSFECITSCFLLLFFSLLCGLTDKLNKEFQSASSPCGQFYTLRLMFLLTALRPELRAQLKQVSTLSSSTV